MELIALTEIRNNAELYKLVDFLNKNLKNRGLIFGLSRKDADMMTITIYDTQSQSILEKDKLEGVNDEKQC